MAANTGQVMGSTSGQSDRQTQNPVVRVAKDIRTTHGPDGAIVLDIRQGQMFQLNPVGSTILELLQRHSTEDEIAEILAYNFGIDQATAEADLREFIQSLVNLQLLIVEDGNPLV